MNRSPTRILLPALLLACGAGRLPALGRCRRRRRPAGRDPRRLALLRIAARAPLAALVLAGDPAEAATLRRAAGLWFALGVPAGGCLPPPSRTLA